MSNYKCEKIGRHTIYLDQMYYLAYAGGKRELAQKDQKLWDKTILLPPKLARKERDKLGLDKNPNVFPIKGVDLISFIKELGFLPFFNTEGNPNVLVLTDIIIYESIKQKTYDKIKHVKV